MAEFEHTGNADMPLVRDATVRRGRERGYSEAHFIRSLQTLPIAGTRSGEIVWEVDSDNAFAWNATLFKWVPLGHTVGDIDLWSGAIADIPRGWVLCDGANGTPDLTDRFVLGAGGAEDPDATGGSASASLGVLTHDDDKGGHEHDATLGATLTHNNVHDHQHGITNTGYTAPAGGATIFSTAILTGTASGGIANHTDHTILGHDHGEDGVHQHEDHDVGDVDLSPPWYALAYKMCVGV